MVAHSIIFYRCQHTGGFVVQSSILSQHTLLRFGSQATIIEFTFGQGRCHSFFSVGAMCFAQGVLQVHPFPLAQTADVDKINVKHAMIICLIGRMSALESSSGTELVAVLGNLCSPNSWNRLGFLPAIKALLGWSASWSWPLLISQRRRSLLLDLKFDNSIRGSGARCSL